MNKYLITVVAAVALSGCAGRSPAPVAVVQPQDRYMDCAAISIEVQANNAKVQQLASDQGLKTTQNVAAGVAGIFIPVLWFGMDFQGTADKETQALQSRQQYLASLAEQSRATARQGATRPVSKKSKKRKRRRERRRLRPKGQRHPREEDLQKTKKTASREDYHRRGDDCVRPPGHPQPSRRKTSHVAGGVTQRARRRSRTVVPHGRKLKFRHLTLARIWASANACECPTARCWCLARWSCS